MKKFLSISLTIVMLAAILHFSVAIHYCGGKIAATKISLTGKLASCGMEDNDRDLTLPGSHFTNHCCDNILAFFGINSKYFPSFSSVPVSYHHLIQGYNIQSVLTIHSFAPVKSIFTSISPPGAYITTSVDLSDICIFRI